MITEAESPHLEGWFDQLSLKIGTVVKHYGNDPMLERPYGNHPTVIRDSMPQTFLFPMRIGGHLSDLIIQIIIANYN